MNIMHVREHWSVCLRRVEHTNLFIKISKTQYWFTKDFSTWLKDKETSISNGTGIHANSELDYVIVDFYNKKDAEDFIFLIDKQKKI